MTNPSVDLLKQVIDTQHGGVSTYKQSVRVHRHPPKPGLWDGVVHIFTVENNDSAKLAYAWAAPVQGGNDFNYFAVLHQGRIRNAIDAVASVIKAIMAQQRQTKMAA